MLFLKGHVEQINQAIKYSIMNMICILNFSKVYHFLNIISFYYYSFISSAYFSFDTKSIIINVMKNVYNVLKAFVCSRLQNEY